MFGPRGILDIFFFNYLFKNHQVSLFKKKKPDFQLVAPFFSAWLSNGPLFKGECRFPPTSHPISTGCWVCDPWLEIALKMCFLTQTSLTPSRNFHFISPSLSCFTSIWSPPAPVLWISLASFEFCLLSASVSFCKTHLRSAHDHSRKAPKTGQWELPKGVSPQNDWVIFPKNIFLRHWLDN